MAEVSSIVLFSPQLDRTIAFYRSLGVELQEEDHGDGLTHAATEVGDVHVAVFPHLTEASLRVGGRAEAPSSGSTSTHWMTRSQGFAVSAPPASSITRYASGDAESWSRIPMAGRSRSTSVGTAPPRIPSEGPGGGVQRCQRLVAIDGVVESRSMFSDRSALWVNGKEIAHRDAGGSYDVRLTQRVIRQIRDRLRVEPRMHLRRVSDSDWVEVDVSDADGEELVVGLLTGGRRGAPPASRGRLPPTSSGQGLARRRRFH